MQEVPPGVQSGAPDVEGLKPPEVVRVATGAEGSQGRDIAEEKAVPGSSRENFQKKQEKEDEALDQPADISVAGKWLSLTDLIE